VTRAEQIVGRERRERLSQLEYSGGGCFDSRRRVNSTVMFLSLIRIGIVLLVSFPVAEACVCQSTPTVTESFSKNTVIFTGTVIARGKYGAWLRVDKPWKGVSSRTIYLYTGNLRNDCDPWFGKTAERWLVYARLEPLFRYENSKTPYTRRLIASGCDRTTLLVNAAEDLKTLAVLKR
jgi:hypothetical protein